METVPPASDSPQPAQAPQFASHAMMARPPRRPSVFVRLLYTLLFFVFVGSLGLNALFLLVGIGSLVSTSDTDKVVEKYYALNRSGTAKVAVLSIEGAILSGEDFFKQQIDHARKDIEAGHLKAMVLRVNSPGGTISGSDYMLHHLRKLVEEGGRAKIPIVVSMGAMAASGGYYVSMCVGDTPDTIFAEKSTWTGSIGVIIPHYNIAGLMKEWGVQSDSIVSHPLKEMGTFTRDMTPAEKEILQKLVNEGFTQFKDVIKSGRPQFRTNPEALDRLATGQIFTATQALNNGLIDRIGFVEDAIDRAIELAKLDKSEVKVVKYKSEPRFSEILFGEAKARPIDLSALLDATSPRAYYLCTWLPSAL